MSTNQVATVFCDFCGKSQHEVFKIIVGPKGVAICSECVSMSVGIFLKADEIKVATNTQES